MGGTSDLEQRYRDYLGCLNARRFDDLGAHVGEDVLHNGVRLGLGGYRAMLENDVGTVPDLVFDVRLLVATGDTVGAILGFECTPVREFRGLPPTGRAISFTEHVFYRYRGGTIAQVWSLLDDAAIRAQLS
ncbi:ester cyclase [Actinomycetospora sp. OC33-EN08]|uniref:Ester cyclase n=1 Tax=Actinomycetospora aurantiaca TaxID=3129233 RepID=A0ABU8MP55_9PSEU